MLDQRQGIQKKHLLIGKIKSYLETMYIDF